MFNRKESMSDKVSRIRSAQEFCDTYYYHKYLYVRTGSQKWLGVMVEHTHPKSDCVDGLLRVG